MQNDSIIHWAGASVSGSRKEQNEDSWVAFSSNIQGTQVLGKSGQESLQANDLVFAVSDGMGGGNAGDLASSLILERMPGIIAETFKVVASGFYPDPVAHLEQALKEVHEHINEAAAKKEAHKGMAATLAFCWFTPDNMYLANVGDSRVYRSRDGKLEQLSKDHTLAWSSWKRGEIGEMQYRSHPRRSALFRVIGGGHAKCSPYFAAISFKKGDRFLICSDGLIDGLWERQINEALGSDRDQKSNCEALLERAIENAGSDDTTLIVLEVK
ncbi:MAG: PP2C family serine/threonine-protein phosphatase [Akkermansiaceae bacterium]